jgi:hypothetical protein
VLTCQERAGDVYLDAGWTELAAIRPGYGSWWLPAQVLPGHKDFIFVELGRFVQKTYLSIESHQIKLPQTAQTIFRRRLEPSSAPKRGMRARIQAGHQITIK